MGDATGQDAAYHRQARGGSTDSAEEPGAQAGEAAADPSAPPGQEKGRSAAGDRQTDSIPDGEGSSARADPLNPEERQAVEQWLRRIPDDPGGLLCRKFLYQYQQRAARPEAGSEPW